MEIAKFTEFVLGEVGTLDASETADGEDAQTVLDALRIVHAELRAKDIIQTVLDETNIEDRLAPSLIILVAYQIAPQYGFPRNEVAKLRAEQDVIDVTRTQFRSETLRKSTFLGTLCE